MGHKGGEGGREKPRHQDRQTISLPKNPSLYPCLYVNSTVSAIRLLNSIVYINLVLSCFREFLNFLFFLIFDYRALPESLRVDSHSDMCSCACSFLGLAQGKHVDKNNLGTRSGNHPLSVSHLLHP